MKLIISYIFHAIKMPHNIIWMFPTQRFQLHRGSKLNLLHVFVFKHCIFRVSVNKMKRGWNLALWFVSGPMRLDKTISFTVFYYNHWQKRVLL